MGIKEIFHNKTLRNGGLFSAFSFFGKGVSFLIVLLLAGYLEPDDYGKLSLFNTVVSLASFLMAFSTAGYISVTFFSSSRDNFNKDLSSVLFWGVISLVLLLLIVVFCQFFRIPLPIEYKYVYFGVLIAFSVFLFNLHQDILRVQEKVINYGVFNCSNAILNLVTCFVLVDIYKYGWTGRVYSYLVCALVFALLAVYLLTKEGYIDFHFEKKRLITVLKWGIPLIPHSISSWLRAGADQNIINSYYGTYEVGMFGFALNLMSIIITIGIAFNSSNSVSIYQILSSDAVDKKDRLTRQTRILLFVYFVMAVVAVISATLIVRLWYTKYLDSLNYFYILSIMGFLQCVYFLYCNYLFYYSKTKELMFITFGSSLLHFILSLIFTRYSLYYTCIIYVFVQVIIVSCVYMRSKKLLNYHLR